MTNTAIIGGGPAGMMAAFAAARTDTVTLYEKNEKLGKKLFLTGKGRCNITNVGELEDFFNHIPGNAKFLYSAFSCFSNKDLIALLNKEGLTTKMERGGRIFPASDKSSDVIKTLSRMLAAVGVQVCFNSHVEEILVKESRVTGLKVDGEQRMFDKVILATGGLSYPKTGSTGEGYAMAQALGHRLKATHPSLIPLVAHDIALCRRLMGVSLKNVAMQLYEKGKKTYSGLGEMLFTHFGVTGPLVLSASAYIRDYTFADTYIALDLKPGLDDKKLDERILRDFSEFSNKQLKNAIYKLLPRALCPEVIDYADLDGEKYVNETTRTERLRLISALKAFTIRIVGTRSIDEAIITKGGIDLRDVNASTMESKLVKGLFFAGEILDVDACTGGYNLQIAFSTGYLSGMGRQSIIDNHNQLY